MSKFCAECFSELMKNGTCPECTEVEAKEQNKLLKKFDKVFPTENKIPRGKWEPNIKPDEKWFAVKSDYKAYK